MRTQQPRYSATARNFQCANGCGLFGSTTLRDVETCHACGGAAALAVDPRDARIAALEAERDAARSELAAVRATLGPLVAEWRVACRDGGDLQTPTWQIANAVLALFPVADTEAR